MKKIILASLLVTAAMANASTDITLSRGIKPNLRAKIERDLDVLDGLKFKTATPEALKLMDVSTLNAQSAGKWLGVRVNYVIEEDALSIVKLLLKRAIFVEKKGVTYPNQDILPYSIDPLNGANAEGEGFTVMSNIGAGLYMGGKKENVVYGMKVSRGVLRPTIKVVVESPRAGIIQIGEGLFVKDLTVNTQNQDALANTLNRLATFFHEARHSDGNGSSLGFAHSLCPAGHDYEGQAACDESLNGPYTVGAVMMSEMIKTCDDNCSERDKEILKMIEIDSASRIMKTTKKGTPATEWDATPESL